MSHSNFASSKRRFSNARRVKRRDLVDAINMLTPYVPANALPYVKTYAQQLASKPTFGQSDIDLARTQLRMTPVRPEGDLLEFLVVYLEILAWEAKLRALGDDAQLANVDLQNMLQRQQQTLQMMSNISKMLYDAAQAVIRKMGG